MVGEAGFGVCPFVLGPLLRGREFRGERGLFGADVSGLVLCFLHRAPRQFHVAADPGQLGVQSRQFAPGGGRVAFGCGGVLALGVQIRGEGGSGGLEVGGPLLFGCRYGVVLLQIAQGGVQVGRDTLGSGVGGGGSQGRGRRVIRCG